MTAARRSLVRRLIAFDEFMPIFPVYAMLFAGSGLSTSEISSPFILWSVVTFVLEVPSGAWANTVSRRPPELFRRWPMTSEDSIAQGARATVTSVAGLLAEIVAVVVFAGFAWGSLALSLTAMVAILSVVVIVLGPAISRWMPPSRLASNAHE